jgi:hypothetical protein
MLSIGYTKMVSISQYASTSIVSAAQEKSRVAVGVAVRWFPFAARRPGSTAAQQQHEVTDHRLMVIYS